ncbi:MAG: hypothetical protein IPL61_19450 [Myxococcales bacterium]|nr:hypothetical protein [Myxococcales bacterium]
MPSWIGDSNWMYGPLVLSGHDVAAWTKLRARATKALTPHHRGTGEEAPVLLDIGGPVLVLPSGRETAWHPRPWGGFFTRMIDLENVVAQDAGAKWKPDATTDLAPTALRLAVRGPLHFVDFATAHDAPAEGALAIELPPGDYLVDVANQVKPDRRRMFQVIRLRKDGVEIAAAKPAKAKPDPDAWLDAPATATSKKIAKGLKLAESEGAEILLVSGDDYAKGKRGIVFDSPDPSGFIIDGPHIIIYRQLGADDRAQAVATALAVPDKRWKKTRKRVVVGTSRALYLVDGDAEPADVLGKKRLGDDAVRLEVAPGTYALSSCGEVQSTTAILDLHRLTRA